MRWMIAALAFVEAAYMLVDGVRAITVGEYLTPSSGEHAGRLGPWATVVEAVGIGPRSPTMKWIFVTYGIAWLVAIIAFASGQPWSWWAMAAFAIGSLWYLVPGTVISVTVLVLLFLPGIRSASLG